MMKKRTGSARMIAIFLLFWVGCGHDERQAESQRTSAGGGSGPAGGGAEMEAPSGGAPSAPDSGGRSSTDGDGGRGLGGELGSGGSDHSGGTSGSGGTLESGGSGIDEDTGGTAGMGGWVECSSAEAALCDDGDDCTSDECTEAGCHHEAITEGASCDDNENPRILGDVDGNGCVDQVDYDLLADGYNQSVQAGGNPDADFNNDGWVDFLDYLFLYDHWQEGC